MPDEKKDIEGVCKDCQQPFVFTVHQPFLSVCEPITYYMQEVDYVIYPS